MSEIVIAVIPKNDREQIRVTLSVYNGRQIVGARAWFLASDGEMRPGKSGIAFRIELLPLYAQAVAEAERQAKEQGLL